MSPPYPVPTGPATPPPGRRPDRSGSPAGIRARAAVLRRTGLTWAQIGAVLQAEYRLTALQAIRLAHGWTQPEAADAWCRRWPEQPKTLKAFSYWELWPAPSGRQPKLAVLIQLAELYQCHVADLVAGLPDFTHLDPAHRPTPPPSHLLAVTDRPSPRPVAGRRPCPSVPALAPEAGMRLALIGYLRCPVTRTVPRCT